MTHVTYLTPGFAVAAQIEPGDVEQLARAGFQSIIAVRPDGEDQAGPTARDIGRSARASGLTFRYVPATSHALMEAATIERFEAAIGGLAGPVLAYCKSGQRAAIVWALAAARYYPAPCVGEALRKAGVDPELIEDELKGQRHKAGQRPLALAVECDTARA